MLNIWIDCDPGVDDAIMLAVAGANRDRLNILGISTVAGNVNSDTVTRAALGVSCFFGMEDVPVYRGACQPLKKVYKDCADVHGENGLGGVEFPAGTKTEENQDAVSAIVRAAEQLAPEKIILVATGPLTNAAILLRDHPEVKQHLEKIVWMGGSAGEGNTESRYAEFNCFVDPDAAKAVFDSGVPIVMCDLLMTKQCRIYRSQIDAMKEDPETRTAALGRMLYFYANTGYYDGLDYIEVYDAATMLYLLHPEVILAQKQVRVEVITEGEQEGRTVCTPDPAGNVLLPETLDISACNRMILKVLQ